MKENKVITNIEQLTPEWLTIIFKKKGYLSDGEVTKITKKNSQVTFSSDLYFLEIDFSSNAQMKPASPEIFVKIPKLNDISKLDGKHEAKFYSIITETMDEMPIPTCYDAAYSEETGLSHIILENLSDTHIELSGFPNPPSKRYCERAIDCLAELHAFWWNHPKLKELAKHAYILYTFKENSFNEKEVFNWFESQNKILKPFLKFLEGKISDKRIELFKTVFSLFPQLAYERIEKKNITVLHADAHFWNFFYPKDISNEKLKARLTDWQFWSLGVGGQDLALMIGFFLSSDTRRLWEKDLIKRYYNDLLEFDIKNYSWDQCWYDYKFYTLLNLYRIVKWWTVGIPSKDWWLFLAKRAFLTIEDLNCIELLESKE